MIIGNVLCHVFIARGEQGRRFVLQQPLLYSETAYNYRRLSELWYQLMHSGLCRIAI
jgi:hypothetical protein